MNLLRKKRAFSFVEFIIYGLFLCSSIKLGMHVYNRVNESSIYVRIMSEVVTKHNCDNSYYSITTGDSGAITLTIKDHKLQREIIANQLQEALGSMYAIENQNVSSIKITPLKQ